MSTRFKPYDTSTPVTAEWLNSVDDLVVAFNSPGGGGSNSVTFKQAGAGAVVRTVQDELRDTMSVKQFGALGNGVAVDTVGIQACLDAAAAAGKFVRFPAGNYLTGRLNFPAGLRGVRGDGIGSTTLTITGALVPFEPALYFSGLADFHVSDLAININSVTYAQNHAMQFGTCSKGIVEKLRIIGGGYINLYAPTCSDVTFNDILADTCAVSMFRADTTPQRLTLKNLRCLAYGNGHNFALVGGGFHRVTKCYAPGAAAAFFSFSFNQVSDSMIDGCTGIGTFREVIQITDGSRNKVYGNELFCNPGHNDFGISVFADTVDIDSNDIWGNTIYNTGKSGIALVATPAPSPKVCQRNKVSDNFVINPNKLDEAFGAGVILYGGPTCAGNVIQHNVFTDISNKMRYGVNEWNTSGNPDDNRCIFNSCLTGGAVFISEANIVGSVSQAFDLQWQNFATVVTALSGTITTVDTANTFLKYKRRGRSAEISAQASITTNGTGAGTVLMSLPAAIRIKAGAPTGRESTVTGNLSYGYDGGAGLMRLVFYTGAYPGANGARITVAGTVEI